MHCAERLLLLLALSQTCGANLSDTQQPIIVSANPAW